MKHYAKYTSEIERVENYELAKVDNFKGWDCHHRLETHNGDGERRLVDISMKELIALNMYYDRPPEELVFMKTKDHRLLHKKGHPNPNKGKHRSEETKRKISEALKGQVPWNKGVPRAEETKKKISETLKGRPGTNRGKKFSEEWKRNISEARKGMHWKLVDGKRVYY